MTAAFPQFSRDVAQLPFASNHASRRACVRSPPFRVSFRSSFVGLLVCILMLTTSAQLVPDCPILPNTDGITPYNGTHCQCINANTSVMYWDNVGNTGCLYRCSKVVNSDRGADSFNCNCLTGYQWNPVSGLC